jgi:hypothetical protein
MTDAVRMIETVHADVPPARLLGARPQDEEPIGQPSTLPSTPASRAKQGSRLGVRDARPNTDAGAVHVILYVALRSSMTIARHECFRRRRPITLSPTVT